MGRVSLSSLNSLSSISLNNLFQAILRSLVSFLINCYHCLFHTYSVIRKTKLKQLSRVYLQKLIAYNLSISVRQSTRHWISVPGEDSKYFCHCIWVSELPRKTQCSETLDGTMLYSHATMKGSPFPPIRGLL